MCGMLFLSKYMYIHLTQLANEYKTAYSRLETFFTFHSFSTLFLFTHMKCFMLLYHNSFNPLYESKSFRLILTEVTFCSERVLTFWIHPANVFLNHKHVYKARSEVAFPLHIV